MRFSFERARWWGAAAGLAMGAFDVAAAHFLRIDFRLEGRDVTLEIFLFLAGSFAAFGWMVGRLLEALRTERRVMEQVRLHAEQIAEARVQLAQTEKLASLGQLASAIAHEVRNPLAIIRSSVQNLAEALPPEDSDSARSCGFVLEEIDRLTRVTTALLGFARPIAVRRAPLLARELLERSELIGKKLCEARALHWSRSELDGDLWLDGDRDLLCQALLGMLDNAAQVTPPGGEVRVEASREREQVVFSVSDTGPGIPRENRDKIFEPFFTTRQGGHGLGLAIARQIVEAHGGKIELGEREGGGARFEVRLPLRAAA